MMSLILKVAEYNLEFLRMCFAGGKKVCVKVVWKLLGCNVLLVRGGCLLW